MKGVSINIYRTNGSDCTNGGVSSPANAEGKIFVVFDEDIERGNYDLDECKDDPRYVCLGICRRRIGSEKYMNLYPLSAPGGMMGGNFGYTTDSRMRRVAAYPLPIHDRIEA